MSEYEIYYQLAEKTGNEIIVVLVTLSAIVTGAFIQLYRVISTERKERRKFESGLRESESKADSARNEMYLQREAQIIQVITLNTEAIAGLKFTLENSGVATASSLSRIHERIDSVNKTTENIARDLEIIKTILNSPN